MIMFEDFNAKIGREDICKQKTVKECKHEINNDHRVDTSKNLTFK
jgi:hypothetical protein